MLPGMQWEIPYARELIAPTNRLAAAARESGAKVIWLQMTLEQESERWSVYFDFIRRGKDKAKDIKTLSRGTEGHALHKDLDVQAGDIIVEKTRYSAFIQGSSELDNVLKRAGIDTLIMVGTVTNGCCECTARDAMMLNYKVIFVSDGNAARTDEEHNGALSNILRNFGDVISTDQVIERLERAHAAQSLLPRSLQPVSLKARSCDLTCRGVQQPSFFCRRSWSSSYCWRRRFSICLGYGFLDTQYGQDQIEGVTLAHYRKVLSDPFFLRIFAKTLLLSALTTAVVSVFGYALAHFIWRQRRWRALFVSLAVSPLLVSIVVSSYGWMVILGNNGIINRLLLALGAANSPVKLIYTDAAIVVGLVHITLPFMILSILAALERIDEFLPEAASTLGANPIQVLRHVILPLALPGFAAGTTVVFCLSMSAYVTPAVLGGSGPNFITTLIYNEFITQLNWPVGAALASLLLLISLSIVFGYIRFMSRLNVGSAKAET